MTSAALIGAMIGYAFDGTARPLAIALLVSGIICLALVLFSEKGRLFAPPQAQQRFPSAMRS